MASARFAWGIDIGNRALKAVKLVRDGDQLKVDDFELIEHEHVLSNAGDNRDQLIQTALANFVQRHPQKGGVVAIGVAGQSSFARFIKLPPVEEKKIPEIVKFEAIQQIPFPLDDVEWSYQLFRSAESPDVEVGIFAMRKDLIQRHIQFFTDFDMNVQLVQMNPLAVYNAVYYDQRIRGTTMVIDLGAENTDLIICDNDSVWMRSIPIGGNNFTETLVKAFKLPFAKAEDLKRNAATSKYARQIFQAMRPVFADLVAEIQRSVGFYASVHRDSRIKKIIALGGTFRLPGLQKYLQQNLSLDVERLDNIAAGAPSDPKLAATFNENLLSVVGAYGLAVQAMGEGKITSSLLPASIRREKLWKEKTPIFAAAAAVFCIGTGVALTGYFLQDVKYKGGEEARTQITRIKTEGEALDKEWSDLENSGQSDRDIIKNVLSLQKYRDMWRHMLHDVENAVPLPRKEVLEGLQKQDAELIKKVPRGERELVIIRSMNTQYVPNIGPLLDPKADLKKYATEGAGAILPAAAAAPSMMEQGMYDEGVVFADGSMVGGEALMDPMAMGGGGTGAGVSGPQTLTIAGAAASGQRGYLITIKGITPNANGTSLVQTKFCGALEKVQPTKETPSMNYAFKRAVLTGANLVSANTPRLTELKTIYAEMLRTRPQPTAQPTVVPGLDPLLQRQALAQPAQPAVEDPAPYMDRVTNEDIRNDTEFTVVLVVLLDPPAWAPPAPAEGAAADAAALAQ
jgi:type IV pilus assembly protein PilM